MAQKKDNKENSLFNSKISEGSRNEPGGELYGT